MAQINIGQGQGITQAIASHLGMSKDDCKKVGLAQWQQVMTLVDQNNTQNKADSKESIFTGGNNVQDLGNKANWKTDFVVQQGTVEIQQSFWDKIVAILKPSAAANTEAAEPVSTTPETPVSESTPEITSGAVEESTGDKLMEFAEDISELHMSKMADSGKEFAVISKEDWNAVLQTNDGAKIDAAYKQAFTDLGVSFNTTLDRAGGNGDGELTFVEFKESGLYEKANGDASLKKAFDNFDINSDGKIDKKEMAAFLRLVDNSVNPNEKGGDNARIDAYSFAARLMAMENPEMKENILAAYKHLFGE